MEIQIFNHSQFGDIRTAIDEQGYPLFCLLDICNALGLSNARMVAQRLDTDEVRKLDLRSKGGATNFVTESGMYSVILRSDNPLAKNMRKWVTSEVLPSIRKTGGYLVSSEQDTPETIMARAILVAKETIDRQKAQLEEQAPRVLFAKAVESSSRSILIGELAKIIRQNGYQVGQNRLFAELRQRGFLGQRGEYYNVPTQRAMDMGLFEIKKTSITKPDGAVLVTTTTKVSGKGQIYFVDKFLKNRWYE